MITIVAPMPKRGWQSQHCLFVAQLQVRIGLDKDTLIEGHVPRSTDPVSDLPFLLTFANSNDVSDGLMSRYPWPDHDEQLAGR